MKTVDILFFAVILRVHKAFKRRPMTTLITIQISSCLSHELAEKIALAQWNTNAPAWVNCILQSLFDEEDPAACLDVVATDQSGEVAGRLHCIRNQNDSTLWYYGDLFVVPAYRRMGVATQMVNAARGELSLRGATRLWCYVEPENHASLALQRSLGFTERHFETFNLLINDGQILFECSIPSPFNLLPATVAEAYFACILYAQNREALHSEKLTLPAWKELLSANDPDEAHYLICRGALPVGYLKLNGLMGDEKAWISMLVVAQAHQRTGVGSFALAQAESLLKEKGFSRVGIQTTKDNLPARALYRKMRYTETISRDTDRCFYEKPL